MLFVVRFMVVHERVEEFLVACRVMSGRYVMCLLGAGGLDVAGLLAAVADALLGDLRGAVAGKVTGLATYK
jgi:hypothetical protein